MRRDAALTIGLLLLSACVDRKQTRSMDDAARQDSSSADVVVYSGTGGAAGAVVDGAHNGAGGSSPNDLGSGGISNGAGGSSSDGLGLGGNSGGAGGQRESTRPPELDASLAPSGGMGGLAGKGTGGTPGSGGASDGPILPLDARGTCPGVPCDTGSYCNSGTCIPTVADGNPCSADAQCSHGHCVSGTCCNTSCGTCRSCSTGTCNPATVGSACGAGGSSGVCDAVGNCNACNPGSACTDGIDAACQIGSTDCSTGKPVCKASNKSGSCGAGPSCSAGYATPQSTCVNGACSAPAAVKCQSGSCDGSQCLSCSSAPGASVPPTAILGASSTPICPNKEVSLTVSGGALGVGASWVWTANSTYLTSTTSATVTVAPSSSTTYSVYAEGPCNKTSPAPSAVVSVSSPPAFAQHPESQSVPCGAGSVAVSVTPATGTSVASYEWHRSLPSIPGDDWIIQNGAYFSGQDTPTLTIVPVETQLVWCVIKDSCERSATSSKATVTVPAPGACM